MCGEQINDIPGEAEHASDDSPEMETSCWRCELPVSASISVCPHCAARLKTKAAPSAGQLRSPLTRDPVRMLFISFVLLLATGIVHYFVLGFHFDEDQQVDALIRQQILVQIFFVEAIDTAIVLVVLAKYSDFFRGESSSASTRIAAWIGSVPLLLALLTANFFYHSLLRDYLQVPILQDELSSQFDLLFLLVVCIQPAVVEEAYCRGFALQVLRSVTDKHAAIWIAGVIFSLMHVAVPLSMPYFVLFGVCLGYLRQFSGTIWLPVVIHFTHNLAISLLDLWLAT